jgi:hypothetical protein
MADDIILYQAEETWRFSMHILDCFFQGFT